MKKLNAIILGCLLTTGFAFAGEPSAADQKWLTAVEKMVTDGKSSISTSEETRANLLKEWAEKKGYTAKVEKTDKGFRVDVSKSVAKN